MSTLSPYERVMKVINSELPDRVPVVPQITYTTAQLTGISLLDALSSPKKTAEALLTGQRELGYDAIYVGWESSFNLLAEAMGSIMRFPEDSVPQVAEYVIREPSDLHKIQVPDPYNSGRLPIHMETLKLVKEEVGDRIPLFCYTPGPFTLAGQLYDVNQLMMATIQDPDFVRALTTITTKASVTYAAANIELGADVIVTADPTASGSLISPATFKSFAAPCIHEVIQSVSKAGVVPSLHICGKTTPILEMMADMEPKIIELDHLVDLRQAKKRIGDRVIIMGNLNPTELLLQGTPKAVEKAAKNCIDQVGKDGRYILSSGCELPPLTPLENVKAMVRAAKKFGQFISH